jgi:DNA-binding response OmpR family regulator
VSSRTTQRIFVVDDEPVIASTLTSILNMSGFSARGFTAPLDALAASQSDPPDLLISDVAMPGLSGVDLAIQMQAQYPSCRILLLSGHAATLELFADAPAKGHDFPLLLKPIHPTTMLANVGALARKNHAAISTIAPVDIPTGL